MRMTVAAAVTSEPFPNNDGSDADIGNYCRRMAADGAVCRVFRSADRKLIIVET
ncbi:MAG: hypothetical protein IT435_11175 [Phycisphaerales bacterium]|nr:hypothetical protein [Phycisphaerales bacterium]